MKTFPQKWRPSLSMVVVTMLLFVLSLPLGGIWIFRFYDSQLVRETESELIAQGAFIKAMVVRELEKEGFDPSRLSADMPATKNHRFNLILPQLDLSNDYVLPSRPDAAPTAVAADPAYLATGQAIRQTIVEAQKTTLAGFRVLDHQGIVVMGRSELGQSLAHVPEVSAGLSGKYASVLRKRLSDGPTPPIYSISRGTGIRVFTARPFFAFGLAPSFQKGPGGGAPRSGNGDGKSVPPLASCFRSL